MTCEQLRAAVEAERGIYTSGWAREIEGKTPVNRTSHLEVAETSSVGRGLQNLGYSADKRRPGCDELVKRARGREEHEGLIEAIRTRGPKLPDDAGIEIGEETKNLKAYVRENWGLIKDRPDVARGVVAAIEAAEQAAAPPATRRARK